MKVLFVCTGNTCRSPMAEALFNDVCKRRGIEASAESAGICAGGTPVSQNAVSVMSELGTDISGKVSKGITREYADGFDLILTMTSAHKDILKSVFGNADKIHTLGEYSGVDSDVPDPFGGDLNVYRCCRDVISNMVEKVAERL